MNKLDWKHRVESSEHIPLKYEHGIKRIVMNVIVVIVIREI